MLLWFGHGPSNACTGAQRYGLGALMLSLSDALKNAHGSGEWMRWFSKALRSGRPCPNPNRTPSNPEKSTKCPGKKNIVD